MFPFPPGTDHHGKDYLGKSIEEYFEDYISQYPITLEKLDDLLEDFFFRGFNDGLVQGIMQGMAEGIDEKAFAVAKEMLIMKTFSIEQIAHVVDLPEEEVLRIKNIVKPPSKKPNKSNPKNRPNRPKKDQ